MESYVKNFRQRSGLAGVRADKTHSAFIRLGPRIGRSMMQHTSPDFGLGKTITLGSQLD